MMGMRALSLSNSAKGIQASSDISQISTGAGVTAGTGTAIYSYMSSEFIFAAIGAACAILSVIVNIYFSHRRNELERMRIENEHDIAMLAEERRQRESDAWMAALEKDPSSVAKKLTTLPPSDFSPLTSMRNPS